MYPGHSTNVVEIHNEVEWPVILSSLMSRQKINNIGVVYSVKGLDQLYTRGNKKDPNERLRTAVASGGMFYVLLRISS